jgi:hypothetical protein
MTAVKRATATPPGSIVSDIGILPEGVVAEIQKVLAGGEPLPIPIVQYDGTRRSGEELTETLFHCLSEIHYWAAFMDRVLFRKNLKLIVVMLNEETEAWDFTKDEKKDWKVMVNAALGETSEVALVKHWHAIYRFWWRYHRRIIS